MLYREIIAVCSETHTKHINTLCGQNVELLNVKLAVGKVTTELYDVNFHIAVPKHANSTPRILSTDSAVNLNASLALSLSPPPPLPPLSLSRALFAQKTDSWFS
jgi:hypothetical protein